MKYLKQFGIILAVSFVGELFNRLLPLPVPASIYGIVLLFLLLVTGVLPLGAVREAGSFLIAIMPVMFIPAAVGLIEQWEGIRSFLAAYLIVTVVSTVVVMAVSGRVTQAVIRRGKKRNGPSEQSEAIEKSKEKEKKEEALR